MHPYLRFFAGWFICVFLMVPSARASHIVGADFTYRFLGDTLINGVVNKIYKATLYIYQDCITGDPVAISDDNPASFTLYSNNVFLRSDGNIFFDATPGSGGTITVPANFSNECVTDIPPTCLFRKRFERTYILRPSLNGYTIVYQRCCRNSSIINVVDAGSRGSTYFCTIPPTTISNNSAEFRNYPPQIICINDPLMYDHSAIDADGDSLSYSFCDALEYDGNNVKPSTASPPPYDAVAYAPGYTADRAMPGFPPVSIDPVTGIITGTPNRTGRYLVTVCCNEWRNGVLINTTKREFQFVVTNCSKVVVADVPALPNVPNTFIVNCKNNNVQFINNSRGGFNYRWEFGTGVQSTEFAPLYSYPDTGTYTIKLVVNPGTTCPDSIVRLVKIYPTFDTRFTDTGTYCPGLPITFIDSTRSTVKPITQWLWDFGDGNTSALQYPVHTWPRGGTYNVMLASANARGCSDTFISRVVVQDFTPYAGDDTVIVKGESIYFAAQGGTTYSWVPGTQLTDTSISNPVGFYPDTGRYQYIVRVKSSYGCTGYDTINVRIVDNVSFVLPNAFTPNGDGLNDYFRPRSVGYRNMKYFRVYNRWGEEVYFGESLESGWNGTYKGTAAPVGVYFWQLVYVDRFGNEGFMKGDVTLLR
jgi:gliding motility-associated-like protein